MCWHTNTYAYICMTLSSASLHDEWNTCILSIRNQSSYTAILGKSRGLISNSKTLPRPTLW